MGEDYKLSHKSSFYLKNDKAGKAILNKKDVVWVIEGDVSSPCQFTLADCFIYSESIEPPFKSSRSMFNYNISGKSLLNSQILLDKKWEWFNDLHVEYIKKRKNFYPLTNVIVIGLKDISQINFKNYK